MEFRDGEYEEVRAFMEDFFETYYTQRDAVRVCAMVDEGVMSVGLGPDEVARCRREFAAFVERQMSDVPTPVQYFIKEYSQNSCGPGWWTCYAFIGLRVASGNWGMVRYVIRLMATVHRVGDWWSMSALHVSEAAEPSLEREPAAFGTSVNADEPVRVLTQREIGRVVDRLIPGGLITRVNAPGYPLAIGNRMLLKMTGYPDFGLLRQEAEGSFLNLLHPDDVEKCIYTARFIAATGKQMECEYRIRRRDGTYLWVHDMCRKATSTDGLELLVSVLTDMSTEVEYKRRLEEENDRDFLTKVCNRKGAKSRIKALAGTYRRCVFFILDVDNFKQVNDLYGHVQGDEVLKFLAGELREAFGDRGIVCRLGGDEFSVFLPDDGDLEETKEMVRTIVRRYDDYIGAHCPDSGSSVSVGGVYGTGGKSLRTKYQKADANLYRVKNNGKHSFLFTPFDE